MPEINDTLDDESLTDFLIYENRQMGAFLDSLGLTPEDVTSYVINGDEQSKIEMINKIKKHLCLT